MLYGAFCRFVGHVRNVNSSKCDKKRSSNRTRRDVLVFCVRREEHDEIVGTEEVAGRDESTSENYESS